MFCACGAPLPEGKGRGRPRSRCGTCADQRKRSYDREYRTRNAAAQNEKARARYQKAPPRDGICEECRAPFKGHGRRKYCSDRCQGAAHWKRAAGKSFTCVACGTAFVSKQTTAKFCSSACVLSGTVAKRTETYRKKVRANGPCLNDFNCEHCGKVANRSLSGTNKKSGSRNRWCSVACQKAGRELARPAKFTPVHSNSCDGCGAQWFARKAADSCRACVDRQKHRERMAGRDLACGRCGVRFSPIGHAGITFCSDECRRQTKMKHRRAAQRKRRKEVGNKWRDVCRKFGASYEPIRIPDVFARDGWHCQICAKPTPRAARGKYEHFAPELDHRYPVSRGGSHSYSNTQCVCRECNGRKSNFLVALGPLFVRQKGIGLFR